MTRRALLVTRITLALLVIPATGCRVLHDRWDRVFRQAALHDPAVPVGAVPQAAANNPLVVPVRDQDFAWNQIVDTIDDYFEIRSERRVQRVGDVLTEGSIVTHPLPGATALEPWRWDSPPGYERALATLQSIRRTAHVRVLPMAGGYSIEVQVHKELEDVSTPSHSTPGSATPRHDRSLVSVENVDDDGPRTLGWIPLGRDLELEAIIIQELQGRLVNTPDAPAPEVEWPF